MHLQSDRALVPANTPAVRYLHVLISAPPQPNAAGAERTRGQGILGKNLHVPTLLELP